MKPTRKTLCLLTAIVLLAFAGQAVGNPLIEDFELLFSDLNPAVDPDAYPVVADQPATEPTCDELYQRVSALVPQTRTYRKGFFDNPVNAMITTAASVVPPVLALLAIPEIMRYGERQSILKAREQIAVLRQAMARRQCYVEPAYLQ